MAQLYSKEWFDAEFKGADFAPEVRKAAEVLCQRFGIKAPLVVASIIENPGTDPQYIAPSARKGRVHSRVVSDRAAVKDRAGG